MKRTKEERTGYVDKYDLKIIQERINRKRLSQEEYNKHVKEWKEFSLKPRTEEEIKARVLYDNEMGTNTCCISYICRYSKLSESMIEWLCDNTSYTATSTKSYTNKVDWDYISLFQDLSEEFIEKHSKEVNWRHILQKQNLSKSFKKKHQKDAESQEEILYIDDSKL